LQYLLRNLGHLQPVTAQVPLFARASASAAPEVSLDQPLSPLLLLVRDGKCTWGAQSGSARQCSDGSRIYDAGPHFPLLDHSQQLRSDCCHSNLCHASLGKTVPTSVSGSSHVCKAKKLVYLSEGGEEREDKMRF